MYYRKLLIQYQSLCSCWSYNIYFPSLAITQNQHLSPNNFPGQSSFSLLFWFAVMCMWAYTSTCSSWPQSIPLHLHLPLLFCFGLCPFLPSFIAPFGFSLINYLHPFGLHGILFTSVIQSTETNNLCGLLSSGAA